MIFNAPSGSSGLAQSLQDVVRAAAAGAPRSRQRRIGPSSVGHPCGRRVAYEAAGVEPVNSGGDPWPSIIGTAGHDWLARAFRAHNAALGRERWLVERRVRITDTLTGTGDLYDTDTATLIDHKILGADSLKAIKRDGPGDQYRVQVQLYGYGLAREGISVERVALACYPRSGWLSGLHVWSEPYDPAVAEDALARLSGLGALARLLDLDAHPERWALLPDAPAATCTWCPAWRPGSGPADAHGCPGALAA
ncbi:hypothetical protein [Longispora albida]|uniref:hypothetical protein n=1 Tax=Longispora albida TaxID=203523 RepID=UPI000368D470|nr:hypothetical protein [Longispora albida]